jgi:hypothetical protein
MFWGCCFFASEQVIDQRTAKHGDSRGQGQRANDLWGQRQQRRANDGLQPAMVSRVLVNQRDLDMQHALRRSKAAHN